MRWSAAWLLTMGLSACGWQGPALEGHAGLQYQVISFYDAHASERQWSCPNPAMQSVTSTQVVEDTPAKVVMDIRYYWVDWSQASDVPGGSITTCRDFGERTFTFTKNSDGSLRPESMTGPQKRA